MMGVFPNALFLAVYCPGGVLFFCSIRCSSFAIATNINNRTILEGGVLILEKCARGDE